MNQKSKNDNTKGLHVSQRTQGKINNSDFEND